MTFDIVCILISSFSFFAYSISYFTSTRMKDEFKRFNLEKRGLLTIILEILGAAGLLVGLKVVPILSLSSLGLATLMLFGLAFRIKLRDSIWISLPAIFYMVLNTYIFWVSIKLK